MEFFFYDFYKNLLFGGDQPSWQAKLLCGGLTGMSASTLTYPLDLIRTVLSINVKETSSPTIAKTGMDILNKDGPRGLYKGLNSTLLVSSFF